VISAWCYTAGVSGREALDPAELRRDAAAPVDGGSAVVWIDLVDPTAEERELLARQLELNPIVIEALRHPKERTKLVRYGDYFHVAVHDAQCTRDKFSTNEVDIVMGPGWMVTVRHPGDDGGSTSSWSSAASSCSAPNTAPPKRGSCSGRCST